MGCTLVIDTSYGSTVGVVGHEPIIETDSRTHVERLQPNIARAIGDAGLTPADIDTIVVGTGPAPFTGLRAGIVAAKAIAFATGATLVGQNILDAQGEMAYRTGEEADGDGERSRHVTLCVNDARRKQLYFCLNHGTISLPEREAVDNRWIAMDIDYPERIVDRVNEAVRAHAERDGVDYVVDVIGHGAAKYAVAWQKLEHPGDVSDRSVLDLGAEGLAIFAETALGRTARGDGQPPVEPLYLRRPDAEIPAPLKHVLGHEGATRKDETEVGAKTEAEGPQA